MSDATLADALFLAAHPSWSQRDLDETDQDIVDHLIAIGHESARHAQARAAQASRESAAASIRSRIGGR